MDRSAPSSSCHWALMAGLFSAFASCKRKVGSQTKHKRNTNFHTLKHPQKTRSMSRTLLHGRNLSPLLHDSLTQGLLLSMSCWPCYGSAWHAAGLAVQSKKAIGREGGRRILERQQMCEKRKTGEHRPLSDRSAGPGDACNQRIHCIKTKRIRCHLRFLFHLG